MGRIFTIRVRLYVMMSCAMLPLIALLGLEYRSDLQTSHSDAVGQLRAMARVIAADYEARLGDARRLLERVALTPQVQAGDPAACSAQLDALLDLNPILDDVTLYDELGRVRCALDSTVHAISAAAPPTVVRSLRSGAGAMGEPYWDAHTRRWLVPVAVPVVRQDARPARGAVAASIDLAQLRLRDEHVRAVPGAAIAVLSSAGAVIAFANPAPKGFDRRIRAERAAADAVVAAPGPDGVVAARSTDGLAIDAYATVPSSGWRVRLGMPAGRIYAHANDMARRNGLLAALVVLAAITAAALVAEQIRRPIRRIAGAADAVRRGNAAARPLVEGPFELRQLARAFNAMVDSREGLMQSLQESEYRFRELAENVREIFFLRDRASGAMLYVNPAYDAIFGRPRVELSRDPNAWLEAVHPEDRADLERALRLPPSARPPEGEFRIVRPDGKVRWIRVRTFPIERDGAIVRIADLVEDISGRKARELDLQRANRRLAMIGACNQVLVRARSEDEMVRRTCEALRRNGAFERVRLDYSADGNADAPHTVVDLGEGTARTDGLRVELPLLAHEERIGTLYLQSADAAAFDREAMSVLATAADDLAAGIVRQRVQVERDLLIRTATTITESASGSLGSAYLERLLRAIAQELDAAAAVIAPMATDASEDVEALCAIVDGAPRPVFRYRVRGTPCEALSDQETVVIERSLGARFPAAPLLEDLGAEAYVGRSLIDGRGRRIGTIFLLFRRPLNHAAVSTTVLRLFGARVSAEIERDRREARLREQARLLDEARDAIVVRSPTDHRVTYWNRGAERMYGWSADEAMGCSVLELKVVHEAGFAAAHAQLLAAGEWIGELVERRRDGSDVVVDCHWTLVCDAQGAPQRVIAINTDVTERRRTESRLAESEARAAHAHKLDAIGQLTGGVAHDFNNLLTVIIGCSHDLADSLRDRPPLAQLATMTLAAGRRAAELTRSLLAFARRQALEPRRFEPGTMITEMTPLLRRTLGEHIAIEAIADREGWPVFADPGQFETALLNLCVNARDAMPQGGRLLIETANVVLDTDYAELEPDVAAGEYVATSVTDTGIGIAREQLARVFEPFFTTKPRDQGTGLGLSMVHGFARQSGGMVRIYSEVGVGTAVKLYLPRDPTAVAEEARSETAAPEPPCGGETILLVEDDDLLRAHATRLLRELGYDVLVAATGPEALQIANGRPVIDLLFTDVVMRGGMNGPEVAAALQQMRLRLPVLYASGYTQDVIVHRGRVGDGVLLLHKPYDRRSLAAMIRRALAPRTDAI